MMRLLGLWMVLCCGLAAVAGPVAYNLNGTCCVPVRIVADRLGIGLAVNLTTSVVTLTRGEQSLSLKPDRRTTGTGMLSAPAFVLNGVMYAPVDDLNRLLGTTLQEDLAAGTVTVPAAEPLVMPVARFPRSAWVADDTLAGLAPGDYMALAVALWGDPEYLGSKIPGTHDYRFPADPDGGIVLRVTARGQQIVLIRTGITGNVPRSAIRLIAEKLGTGHGAVLGEMQMPQRYGRSDHDYTSPDGDVVLGSYRRGALVLICAQTTWEGNPARTEMTLVKRGFPNAWLPVAGPVDGYAEYRNDRFGFSVHYPRTFTPGLPPENGDGLEFSDAHGFTMIASGGNNVLHVTLASEMQRQRQDFDRVTYTAKGENWIVLSGVKGATIKYQKTWVGPGAINELYLAYPAARKAQYDRMVTRIVESFTPGDLTEGH